MRRTLWACIPLLPPPGSCHTAKVIFWERVLLAGPGWSSLVQPSLSGSQQDFPGGPMHASPSSRVCGELPRSAPPSGSGAREKALDGNGGEAGSHGTHLSIYTCTPISGICICRHPYRGTYSFPGESVTTFPRDWELTHQLAGCGQPC